MKHIRFHSVLLMLIGTGVTCHYCLETPVVKEPGLEVNDQKMYVAVSLHGYHCNCMTSYLF